MRSSAVVLSIYFILTLIMGLAFRKQSGRSVDDFYLAGRKVGGLLLFFTMAATNFSAFTIFGLSGAGYRMGYAFYPVMGFGTGFMALSFILIGKKIYSLSTRYGYVTPADYIFHRYRSRPLKILFAAVLVFFTLPYIAIQAVGGGRSLQSLAGVPYARGAFLVTAFIVLYVILGGMRTIIWTDCIQGAMMIIFTLAAFIIIAHQAGGFADIHRSLLRQAPDHLARSGAGGAVSPGVWFGYLFLWFFADPMFPQLFQRFMVPRNERAFHTTIILYPLVTTFLFFLTVSIGVMGKAVFPELDQSMTDSIFPLLLRRYAGELLGTILLTGSLAALMSTMDSQLLTLTSIIRRDFVSSADGRSKNERVWSGRLVVLFLGAVGFLIALKPPQEILDFVNGTTFNGLSVLAPTVTGGLYWRRGTAGGAVSSIITGEILVVLFYNNILSCDHLLPVVPILGATVAVYILGSLTANPRGADNPTAVFRFDRRLLLFLLYTAAASVPCTWNHPGCLILGLPPWIWWQFVLGLLLSAGYFIYLKAELHENV